MLELRCLPSYHSCSANQIAQTNRSIYTQFPGVTERVRNLTSDLQLQLSTKAIRTISELRYSTYCNICLDYFAITFVKSTNTALGMREVIRHSISLEGFED